jgi:succinate dehydrogenase hydrophobic anchor subunit
MQSIRPPVRYSLEYYLWLFTRLSGILMLLMGAGGIAYATIQGRNYMDGAAQYRWAFFPIYWHVQNSDVPELAPTWSSGFWQVFGVVFVCFAAAHGFNGLRVVLEDYVKNSLTITILRWVILSLFLFTLGAAFTLVSDQTTVLRALALVVVASAIVAALGLIRGRLKAWILFVIFLVALGGAGYLIFVLL